jgi:hypothetical protein
MSKTLTVGSETFEYPSVGQSADWGEEATAWAEKVSEVLNDLAGVNNISLTTSFISNNITDLAFETTSVIAFEVEYLVTREDTVDNISEYGKMNGKFVNGAWSFQVEHIGDAGIDFDIETDGRVKYYTSNMTGGTHTGSIKFRAETIDL